MSAQSLLTWTHYKILLDVSNKEARDWYEKEAIKGMWSVRTLQRNIETDYYQRMLISQKKELLEEAKLVENVEEVGATQVSQDNK